MNCQKCGNNLEKKNESRGVCDNCFSIILKDRLQLKSVILDNISLPVAVINEKLDIFSTNESLLKFVDKSLTEIAGGQLGGDVFNCKYANLPGGCGKTEFCEDCEIRKIVEKTANNGKSYNEDVMLYISKDGKQLKTKMNVSTRVIEGQIFLQVNDMDFIG